MIDCEDEERRTRDLSLSLLFGHWSHWVRYQQRYATCSTLVSHQTAAPGDATDYGTSRSHGESPKSSVVACLRYLSTSESSPTTSRLPPQPLHPRAAGKSSTVDGGALAGRVEGEEQAATAPAKDQRSSASVGAQSSAGRDALSPPSQPTQRQRRR
jgi:hypothetical protein